MIRFCLWVLPPLLILSWRKLLGLTYSGWDTHFTVFPYFIYFCDSVHHGIIPLWNPFIQGGTFFPSINGIWEFSWIYWPFVGLAQIISPLAAYEWMLQFFILFGAVGIYMTLAARGLQENLRLFAAVSFSTLALVPLTGQLPLLLSIASLPWLLWVVEIIFTGSVGKLASMLLGLLAGTLLVAGYPWLSAADLLILGSYCLLRIWRRKRGHRSLLFVLATGVAYASLLLPGLLSLKYNYAGLDHDFISPDPYLRGFKATEILTYPDLVSALGSLVSPIIFLFDRSCSRVPLWSMGIGWSVAVYFILGFFRRQRPSNYELFWLFVLSMGIIYATGLEPVATMVKYLPLLSSNRWRFLGLTYSLVALVFLCANRMQNQANWRPSPRRILIVGIAIICFLFWQKALWDQYALLILTMFMFYYWSPKLIPLAALISCLSIWPAIGALQCGHGSPIFGTDNAEFYNKVDARIRNVRITSNTRYVGEPPPYPTLVEDWYLQRTPYTYGNDNFAGPRFWYMRDLPFLNQLFSLSNEVRAEKQIDREAFATDNAYAEAFAQDVKENWKVPTVNSISDSSAGVSEIIANELSPNEGKALVKSSGKTWLIFYNNYAPGWQAFVNSNPAPLLRINHLFMGVQLSEGTSLVEFKFQPTWVLRIISLPYILMLLFSLLLALRYYLRKKPSSS